MKALVISGGGSKGAFAGGVAEYLIENKKKKYELLIGTSTGSLLISHLAMGEMEELHRIYTNVNQKSIFNLRPFKIKKKNNYTTVSINHKNTIKNFFRGSKTFGESYNLKKLISKEITDQLLKRIKDSNKELVVTVSNLSLNQVEYKSLSGNSFDDFRDWIWGSSNYAPFMSILEKNHYEYADGGFANLMPIEEAIKRGATEIDAIILETEMTQLNRLPSKNPFSLMTNIFEFMQDNIEKQNVALGKLAAKHHNVKLNLYYTPTVLTTNSLIFDKVKMAKWWIQGFEHAKRKDENK